MGTARLLVNWDSLWRVSVIVALALATASIAWAMKANAQLAVGQERDRQQEKRLERIEEKLDKLLMRSGGP